MKKEQEILSKFYEILSKILKENKFEITQPIYHDYHFISKINKESENKSKLPDFLREDIYQIPIKVFYKPNTNNFRLVLPEEFEDSEKIIEIFSFVSNKFIEFYNNKDLLKNDNVDGKLIDELIIDNKKEQSIDKNSKILKVYVDGSYNEVTKKSGWAFCIVDNFKILHKDFGICIKTQNDTRQVVAEIFALYKAILFLSENNIKKALIYYDYKGIENWIKGTWKVKNKEIANIVDIINKEILKNKIEISFVKITSHTGDYFNELVDKLAKEMVKTNLK